MIESFVTHTLNGLYYGFILFMIASGLTIIFGVLGSSTSLTANSTRSVRS